MTWEVLVIVTLVAVVVREMERMRYRAERAEWQQDSDAMEQAFTLVCRERDALRAHSGRHLSLVELDRKREEGQRALLRRGGAS